MSSSFWVFSNFYFYVIFHTYLPLEKGIYGVEKKKDKFKYYKTVPNEIQEWCKDNITKNGFHAIKYINYDGKYTIELINVTKEVKKKLQQNYL